MLFGMEILEYCVLLTLCEVSQQLRTLNGMNRGNEPRKVIAACCNDEYGVLFVDERIDVGFRNKI